jgi:Tol biopolymer transport system component
LVGHLLGLGLALCVHASPDKGGVSAEYPAVSPTLKEVAFSADFDGTKRIWIASMDGSRLRKVSPTATSLSRTIESQPAWSPDARHIAYVSSDGLTSEIWVMQADGAYPVRLTSNGAVNTQPGWSPDGRKIVFVSDKDGSNDIWLMNPDGSQQVKLVTSAGQENDPRISPAGDQIVFSRTEGDSATLIIVGTNGSGSRALTSVGAQDWEPHWSARGIVFSSNRGGSDSWKIWAINPDGTNLRKLGDIPGHDPVWLPDGRIVFTHENPDSKALSEISVANSLTGARQAVVDVQGYLTPIDVRPGKPANKVNPRGHGRVQVSILSTRTFDATTSVVQRGITFGRTGSEASFASCSKQPKDVNGDGIPDLTCRFNLRYAGFQVGDTFAILRFSDAKGKTFEGRDAITTVLEDDPDDLKD